MTSSGLKTLDAEIGKRGWIATDPAEIEVLERTVATLDASPPAPTCDVCGGARYVLDREMRRGGHTRLEGLPALLRDVLPCPACNAPKPADLLAQSGIPDLYADCTFATFPKDPLKSQAVERVRAWTMTPTWSLMLLGANGRGKTGLAVAAVRRLCEQGVGARFTSVVGLLERVRASFDVEGSPDVIAPYRTAPVLVLDDFMAARVTDWVREQMTALVEDRRVQNRPTVITCDVGAELLLEEYGPRLVSRLREYKRITIEGKDLRGAQ